MVLSKKKCTWIKLIIFVKMAGIKTLRSRTPSSYDTCCFAYDPNLQSTVDLKKKIYIY